LSYHLVSSYNIVLSCTIEYIVYFVFDAGRQVLQQLNRSYHGLLDHYWPHHPPQFRTSRASRGGSVFTGRSVVSTTHGGSVPNSPRGSIAAHHVPLPKFLARYQHHPNFSSHERNADPSNGEAGHHQLSTSPDNSTPLIHDSRERVANPLTNLEMNGGRRNGNRLITTKHQQVNNKGRLSVCDANGAEKSCKGGLSLEETIPMMCLEMPEPETSTQRRHCDDSDEGRVWDDSAAPEGKSAVDDTRDRTGWRNGPSEET
jgi:hypothetical protein